MWHDLRQAVRTLRTHPGFVAVAALVLALGSGLNTAIFSIVYAMLFKPLPVEAPHELVSIYQVFPRNRDRPTAIFNQPYEFLEWMYCAGLSLIRGLRPLGLPYTLSRAPLRRRAPFAWLTRSRSFAGARQGRRGL